MAENRSSLKFWFWTCITIVGIFLLAFVGLFYQLASLSQVAETANTWTWHRTAQEEVPKPSNGFGIGVFHPDVSIGNGLSIAYSDSTRIDFRSVAVLTASKHPLEIAVARRLAELLKTCPEIERIQFSAAEPILCKDEEPLPNWSIRIKIDDIKEHGFPQRPSLQAVSHISFGSELIPQFDQFAGDAFTRLEFNGDMFGKIGGSLAGFSEQSYLCNQIADTVAADILKSVKQVIEKYLPLLKKLTELPAAFYPPYQEAKKIPDLPGITECSTLLDGHRLMIPHESIQLLQVQFDDTPAAWLEAVKDIMLTDGWKDAVLVKSEKYPFLRMSRGQEIFYIFREKGSEKDFEFFLERTERMSYDSLYAAIQTLLDNNAPIETFMPFMKYVHNIKGLSQPVLERLRNDTTTDPANQLELARFFETRGEKETATKSLFRAWRARQLVLTAYPSDADYRGLAKKLGVENEMKALPPPDAELFEQFGFHFLKPEEKTITLTADVDKEQRFAAVDSEGYLHLLFLTPGCGETQVSFRQVQKHIHSNGESVNSSSWAGDANIESIGFVQGKDGEFLIKFLPSPDTQQITLSIEYEPRK
jgi:hypothetical protein